MDASWPQGDPAREDQDAEARMAPLQELITQIRRLRKEYGVPEGAEVDVVVGGAPRYFQGTLETEAGALKMLARVGGVTLDGEMSGAGAHGVLENGTELFIPLEGVIDLEREKDRLHKEIQRLEGQLSGTLKKLEKQGFLNNAPEEVVEREREKAASFREQKEKLQEKLTAFQGGSPPF